MIVGTAPYIPSDDDVAPEPDEVGGRPDLAGHEDDTHLANNGVQQQPNAAGNAAAAAAAVASCRGGVRPGQLGPARPRPQVRPVHQSQFLIQIAYRN